MAPSRLTHRSSRLTSLSRATLCATLLFSTLAGCQMLPSKSAMPGIASKSRMYTSVVDRLAVAVQPDIEKQQGSQQTRVLATHAIGRDVPARYKRRIALHTLTDPWAGFSSLEHQGLLMADLSAGGMDNVPALLDVMEAAVDRTSEYFKPLPFPGTTIQRDIVSFLTDTLEDAAIQRERALANLSEDERRFLFKHVRTLADQFAPHSTEPILDRAAHRKLDAEFARLVDEQLDYAALIASAQTLARLGNDRFLQNLAKTFRQQPPIPQPPPGITGDVLFAQQTRAGLLVIGGPGANTYDLDRRTLLVIDLGGDDAYHGIIASSGDIDHGIGMVLDLAGNDTYTSDPLGLATGRLGVGLLADLDGDDVYQLDQGSGGTGFAGIGILFDRKGNDVYMGSRFTQGAAFGGLGLLIDLAGNDRYTSHAFAIGFGGPLGMGAVIDHAGSDVYQCGDKYPSLYHQPNAPAAKPDESAMPSLCAGMGSGAGLDGGNGKADAQLPTLAGGLGYLIDLEGQDHYRSGDVAQGAGYYFGVGVVLDLGGDDNRAGGRATVGAADQYGAGLFVDAHGADRYAPSGPAHALSAASGRSVSLVIDATTTPDTYDLTRSAGLGAADGESWALFIDEGGADRYQRPAGLGSGTSNSLGLFFDLAGLDSYDGPSETPPSSTSGRGNERTIRGTGGLFQDR
ncbi:MAG: conserved exported protein of unknown function [Nitrospira sp.]|nr:MAG: conserved exported protein of unknown function [Nitrospira sp.]